MKGFRRQLSPVPAPAQPQWNSRTKLVSKPLPGGVSTGYTTPEGYNSAWPVPSRDTPPSTLRRRTYREALLGPPSQRGGALKDVSVGPKDLVQLFAKQRSWENMNSAYNDLEPEVKKLFPEPSSPPLYTIVEPFHRYIDEYADPVLLEEADEHAKLMSPSEIKEVFYSNGPALKRLLPFYTLALPKVSRAWMPNLIRAHLMRILY